MGFEHIAASLLGSVPWYGWLIAALAVALLVARRRGKRRRVDMVPTVDSIRRPNTIAVIPVKGVLVGQQPVSPFARAQAVVGSRIRHELRKAAKNKNVAGVLMVYETPGGSPHAAEEIRLGVKDYLHSGKRIKAYVNASCSGGVWAMSHTPEIYAHPQSVLGSVGVIMGTIFTFEGITSVGSGIFGPTITAEKVTAKTLFAGQGKNFGDPFSKPSEEDVRWYESYIADAYAEFKSLVLSGRKDFKAETFDKIGARVFGASYAKEIGLIDGIADEYEVRVKFALDLGLLADDCNFVVVGERQKPPFLTKLFMQWGGQEGSWAEGMRELRAELSRYPVLAMLSSFKRQLEL